MPTSQEVVEFGIFTSVAGGNYVFGESDTEKSRISSIWCRKIRKFVNLSQEKIANFVDGAEKS